MKEKLNEFLSKIKGTSYYEPDKKGPVVKEVSESELLKDLIEKRSWSLDKFKTRRSIRKFSHKPVEWKIIYDIIDASLNAPCAGNVQNYDIIIVEDKIKRHEIGKIEAQQFWLSEAPVLLVVVRDNSRLIDLYPGKGEEFAIQNTAALIENILMLAHIHDLGACWVQAGDSQVLKDYLGVSGKEIDAVIPIGYPMEEPKVMKSETTQRIFFERYGNRKR